MKRIALAACLALAAGLTSAASGAAPSFTAAQAQHGKAAYGKACKSCHGDALDDGRFAPALKGEMFKRHWAGRPAAELFTYLRNNMPPGGSSELKSADYAALMAFVLQANGEKASASPMPHNEQVLAELIIPGEAISEQDELRRSPVGLLTPDVRLPPWPSLANPLERYTPVTDEMLNDPPPSEWLAWRRSRDVMGFSPLAQINKKNVSDLRLVWSLTLPVGTNEIEPLMHDGVLFVHSFGDHVQALDAKTGDELWHYHRQLPETVSPTVKRSMALYGDKLFVGTSDVHEIALDVKTGRVIWDTPIADPERGWSLNGGPLIARGKVMQGIVGGGDGGAFIVALDAETGKEAWRFYTIPRPGEPGGNTWNDLPLAKRHGGSVWTAGSYDPALNLAFFGPAPTYDTGPLRDPIGKPGVTNDALYTDSTIALDPDTGKLVWHYQHVRNDQWDLDWAFERQILHLSVDGVDRKLVVTAGKPGVWDALDAATGEYVFSFDMGLQNIIKAIDPKTGEKTLDVSLIPSREKTVTVCPHGGGGRNWIPTSYNPFTKILYVPAEETCMVLAPVGKGERGFLTTGVSVTLSPREGSDGNYGRVQAIDLANRRALWTMRQRPVQSSGVLATGGGLVFVAAIDRYFTAYDDANGEVLWRMRLNDIANSSPISYEVDGKQYVAIVTGYGGASASTFTALTPEIPLPIVQSASVWVFALPDEKPRRGLFDLLR